MAYASVEGKVLSESTGDLNDDDYLIRLAKRFRVSLTAFQFRLENMQAGTRVALVFYDVETVGLNKRFDQILQFAAVRTDLVETESFETRSRLMPRIVPSPKALHLTGTSLADATNMSRQ